MFKLSRGEGLAGVVSFAMNERPSLISLYMSKFGKNTVESVVVQRQPVVKVIQKFLNLASNNKLEKEKQRLNYDDLYHLSMIIKMSNGHILKLEKNAKVNFELKGKEIPSAEKIRVNVNNGKTFNDMIEGMERIYKSDNLPAYKYNALTNNCQLFILNNLKALNVASQDVVEFVKQDTSGLLGSKLGKVAEATTSLAGYTQSLLMGNGKKERLKSYIHSVGFDDFVWTSAEARRWLKKHNLTPLKRVSRYGNQLRYEIIDDQVEHFKRYSTKKTKDDIIIVFGYK